MFAPPSPSALQVVIDQKQANDDKRRSGRSPTFSLRAQQQLRNSIIFEFCFFIRGPKNQSICHTHFATPATLQPCAVLCGPACVLLVEFMITQQELNSSRPGTE